MLMQFLNLSEAQDFCDKIHKYLQENCPGYNAGLWQIPIEMYKKFYVSLPKEFVLELSETGEKDCYEVKEKISVSLKTETDKSSLTVTDTEYKALKPIVIASETKQTS
jgi:hypothetical protein